jgi:tetratricopeptide (TPR) repeat protein
VISETETTFLGYQAKSFVYEVTQSGQAIHFEEIVFVDEHTIWVIRCVGRPDQKDEIKKIFSFFTPNASIQLNRLENRALLLFQEGKIEEGFRLLKQVTTMEPENPVRRMNYGSNLYGLSGRLFKQGDAKASKKYAKEAEVELKAAIRFFGQKIKNYILISHCYFLLGDIYQFAYGDRIAAKEFYQNALKYNPEHPEAKANMNKLEE